MQFVDFLQYYTWLLLQTMYIYAAFSIKFYALTVRVYLELLDSVCSTVGIAA